MNSEGSRSDAVFHSGTLEAQTRYGNPERARRIIEAMPSLSELDDEQIAFIESLPFFFFGDI